ncbi:MAG TPA: ABC transporter substrate-binding protein [Chloroflexota bacterium]|jgi:NitT/TauT family transport system substrate-binding protein|nr:ABC transporter substrate-binding protein [Chloroflexota bacterium]
MRGTARHAMVIGLVGIGWLLAACGPGATPSAPAPAAAAPAPGTAASAAAAPARLPLRIAYTALVASQSVAWIAYEDGTFERYGLDPTLTFINGGPAGMAALVAGDIDLVIVGAASVIRSAIQGSDAVLIAGTKNRLAGALMVKPEIRTASDLRGRRVGVASRGSNSELVARAAIQQLGLDPDSDVTYLAVGSGSQRVAALQQGAVDACGCIPPDNVVAEDAGFYTLVDVTPLNIKYPATAVGARRSRAAEQPELFTRAIRAMAEGVHRYRHDPEFALQVIKQYTQHDDDRAVRAGYEFERTLMAPDLRVEPEAVQATLEEIAATIPQAASARPEQFVEPRFVDELARSGLLERLGAR